MAYKPERSIYNLDFGDTELSGLHVTMRSLSLRRLFDMNALAELAQDGVLTNAQALDLYQGFADALVWWDVMRDAELPGEEGEQPVPATLEGVMAQDPEFIGAIIQAWNAAVNQAPRPLRSASPPGGTPPENPRDQEERELGLAASSSSPPNSPAPG